MNNNNLSQLFEQTLAVLPHGAIVTDLHGTVVGANKSFSELSGVESKDIVGKNINDYFPVEEKITGEGVFQLSPISNEIIGEVFHVRAHKLETEQAAGWAYFLSGANDSISGHMSWREEKLASLGTLTGEIAHDLNNLLAGILGHVSYLRLTLPESGGHQVSIEAIEEATKGAASMTQRILAFAKGDKGTLAVVSLAEVIRAGTNLLQAALPKNINMQVIGLDKELSIVGDEIALSQIVMNLIVNARDALPEGGDITISIDSLSLEKTPDGIVPPIKPGHYAALSIADNGSGIEKNVLDKIFQPYFTTKSERGTGLGLSTVKSIVEKHSGGISLRSKVGKGTEFIIFLPLHHAPKEKVEKGSKEIPKGTEAILIVDDEDAVRTVMEKSLALLGYEVDSVDGGEPALELYTASPEKYKLVILDMMMPNMSGDEVFAKLREVDSRAAVLIASGYASDQKTKKVLENGGLGFIQKPFAIEDLAIQVRECIENSEKS